MWWSAEMQQWNQAVQLWLVGSCGCPGSSSGESGRCAWPPMCRGGMSSLGPSGSIGYIILVLVFETFLFSWPSLITRRAPFSWQKQAQQRITITWGKEFYNCSVSSKTKQIFTYSAYPLIVTTIPPLMGEKNSTAIE